jgi:hypothetical protein
MVKFSIIFRDSINTSIVKLSRKKHINNLPLQNVTQMDFVEKS